MHKVATFYNKEIGKFAASFTGCNLERALAHSPDPLTNAAALVVAAAACAPLRWHSGGDDQWSPAAPLRARPRRRRCAQHRRHCRTRRGDAAARASDPGRLAGPRGRGAAAGKAVPPADGAGHRLRGRAARPQLRARDALRRAQSAASGLDVAEARCRACALDGEPFRGDRRRV